jgi:hypothetical protein
MSDPKKPLANGVKYLKVAVPQEVAEYYEKRATQFATSISAAASPVLCAQARGEIRQDFTQQPGSDPARP